MKNKKLYIQMFSLHGLLRSERMEMGRDADTGGQIKYVVELCNSLSTYDDIERVDLFTRLIVDKTVADDYGNVIEKVNDKFRIIRIQCGGRKYMRKELLWPHLDEYVDKTVKFIKRENAIPDIIHGHYADAGYVAMELSSFFGIPCLFTGHSLGRNKLQKLLSDGMPEKDIIKKFKIDRRISAEEDVIKHADLIITSTTQEIEKQYGLYENSAIPSFKVIPPGLDIDTFYPYYHDILSDSSKAEEEKHAHASVVQELNRFFIKPDKPIILTLCRPDKRKNISGLIKAYGEDLELQSIANLAIFAGIRKNISDKEENEQDVLTEMLLLMDKYDLYGKMAIPKKHDFDLEVPELYRIVADKKGVFVNAALIEPFGLTLLEASACGLPIVATDDGGPRDIIKNCENGILVNPTDSMDIRKAIKKILTDNALWEQFSKNGIVNVRKHYTWKSHTENYINNIKSKFKSETHDTFSDGGQKNPIGKRLAGLNHFLITDIDNTLIGDENSDLDELIAILKENREHIGFAVATGRTVGSAIEYLKKYNVPLPDIIISSVGTEIYYGEKLVYDKGWDSHLSHRWNPQKIKEALTHFDFIENQEEDTLRKFKVSYYMEPGRQNIATIHSRLLEKHLSYNLIYSHQEFLDILPYRASKGKAIRYLSYKWEIPLENIMVCGDSGNDEEMLRGDTCAVVVSNHSPELDRLKGARKIFFASKECSSGIIEGIKHYDFIERIRSMYGGQ